MSEYVPELTNAMIGLSTPPPPSDGPANSDDEDDIPAGSGRLTGTGTPGYGGAVDGDAPSIGGGGSGARKPRGRPPGSKNKPKPPVVITRESDAAMHPAVLELAGGSDIVAGLTEFSRRRRVGLSVLGGSGVVTNVALRHPSVHSASTVAIAGRFDILSLSGTFLPPLPSTVGGSAPSVSVIASARAMAGLSVSLAGPHGQVIGGTVAGPLTAVGQVAVVVATFVNPEFHRLPIPEEEVPAAVKEEQEEVKPMLAEAPSCSGGGANSLTAQLGHRPEMITWTQPSSSIHPTPPPHAGAAHRPPHLH